MIERVAFIGPTHAGKDSLAEILCRLYGFRRVAFADRLKAEVQAMLSSVGIQYHTIPREWLRPLLQSYGQLRRRLDSGYFIRSVLELIDSADPSTRFVVTDARFLDELEALRERGFFVVWLDMSREHVLLLLQRDGLSMEEAEKILEDPSEREWHLWEPDAVIESVPGELGRMAIELIALLDLRHGMTPYEIVAEDAEIRRFYRGSSPVRAT